MVLEALADTTPRRHRAGVDRDNRQVQPRRLVTESAGHRLRNRRSAGPQLRDSVRQASAREELGTPYLTTSMLPSNTPLQRIGARAARPGR